QGHQECRKERHWAPQGHQECRKEGHLVLQVQVLVKW
ncbi:hypothetical protein A5844_001675, partial [Enterococcus sp. 10A9_DIV0425]